MSIENYFPVLLVLLTSVLGASAASRYFALPWSQLAAAAMEIAECVGASLICFGLNAAAGLIAVFFVRAWIGFFPLYAVANILLIFLSLVQGFLFQRWWRHSRAGEE